MVPGSSNKDKVRLQGSGWDVTVVNESFDHFVGSFRFSQEGN
jgi:hypothetical protein